MSQDNEQLEDTMDREGFGGGVVDDEPNDTKDLALEEVIRSGNPISMHTILTIASVEEILLELRRRGFDRITLSTCSD